MNVRSFFLKLGSFALLLPLFAGCISPESERKPSFSGRYPHLAMFNQSKTECGIGAVVPWQKRLWAVTYSAHKPRGSLDGLYEITPSLKMIKRPESIGGTPANRMIHRESHQLFIGPYAIDQKRNVRPLPLHEMVGRPTANARHLEKPKEKIYYFTMEEGMYEVDVHSLEVNILHKDGHLTEGDIYNQLLPGYHGKGAYTAQGRVVYANNGRNDWKSKPLSAKSGALASWDGEEWKVIQRRQFTEVTGPGGLRGNTSSDDPLWSIGWDYRSLILKLLDNGTWHTYRLPKGDYSYDALHGWHTEWPRIRQVGPDGQYLMNMHGTWYQFPGQFTEEHHPSPDPIATYLKITGDFARWRDRLVFGCDDGAISRFGEGSNIIGRSQSNLWFTNWNQLDSFGNAYGWGGPWVHDDVKKDSPSTAFSFSGYRNRQLHLSHERDDSVTFTLEVDRKGTGSWDNLTDVTVPAKGYVRHTFKDDTKAEWIRLRTNRNATNVTAYFHYGTGGGSVNDPERFRALAPVNHSGDRSLGLVRANGDERGTLQFAAWTAEGNGTAEETGFYEIGPDMNLKRVDKPDEWNRMKEKANVKRRDIRVTDASVEMTDDQGHTYHLPVGTLLEQHTPGFGPSRMRREVVTERDLLNIRGTFYVLPRPSSGGVRRIKPVSTHNKRISDFCTWRGMLVMAGTRLSFTEGEHFVKSRDGRTGLWFGDVDDLWKFGKPRGRGGPWKNTDVQKNTPSEPYLMTGYDQKSVKLSHDLDQSVTFTLEVDVRADGTWLPHHQIEVGPGETRSYEFPNGFSAHWVRVIADHSCTASATFIYE